MEFKLDVKLNIFKNIQQFIKKHEEYIRLTQGLLKMNLRFYILPSPFIMIQIT